MKRALLLTVWSLALALQIAECIRYSEVFPHGEKAGDSLLAKGDNVNVTANLRWSYNIFGAERNKITIGTDGWVYLTAVGEATGVQFLPFQSDVDTEGAGYVSWRETNADSITSVISMVTDSVFPDLAPVNITSAVLIFWIGVGYYNKNSDKTNSFELALATDGNMTFAIYVYANDKMQWTTGDRDGGKNGLGGNEARVGLIRDDGSTFFVRGSNTPDVINVHQASNTGLRGLWYFRVDTDMVVTPDEKRCVLGCDKHADCVDRTIGYSCACRDGYNGEDATVGSCLFAVKGAATPGWKTTNGVHQLLVCLLMVRFAF